jgi:hypothetical protein
MLFMATLRQPYAASKTSSARPSVTADRASAGSTTVTDSRAQEITAIRWLPNRRHSVPAISMVATAPADRPRSARPSSAGEAPVCSLIAGTRTAQLAKMNPCAANTAHRAARARASSARSPDPRRVADSTCWILFTGDTK